MDTILKIIVIILAIPMVIFSIYSDRIYIRAFSLLEKRFGLSK